MRTSKARIRPVELAEVSGEVRDILESLRWNGVIPNLHRTIATYPAALIAFRAWGQHVLRGGNSLSDRQRELMVLRVGWLCRAGYEWVAHVEIGQQAGITDAEIEQLKVGAAHPGWAAADRDLIRAAEEIHADRFVSDATWQSLATRLDQQQLMDVVFTIAQYELVCTILNSFGVQFDAGHALPDDVRAAWNLPQC